MPMICPHGDPKDQQVCSDKEQGVVPVGEEVKVPLEDGSTVFKAMKEGNKKENPEEEDPFSVLDPDDSPPWSELSVFGKIWRILWPIIRIVIVLAMLYLFICSLDVLQGAFQMLGGRAAGQVFQQSELLNNPVAGLIIGILVTVLVQSSSTSSSIVVTMVASDLLGVRQSIPIIMGANIGTSVTNTIVALTQSADREVFRRSFAGATVHDMFNWASVVVFLPIEAASGFLYHMTGAMVKNIGSADINDQGFLKVITKPLTDKIIQIDKNVILAIAEGSDKAKFPMAKYYCAAVTGSYQQCFQGEINSSLVETIDARQFTTDIQVQNGTEPNCTQVLQWNEILHNSSTLCTHLFTGTGVPGYTLSEAAGGAILLITSLLVMILCLLIMVKVLNSLMKGPLAKVIHKVINSDFPGPARHLTGYVAILVGAGLTILVQSSSVFTSTLTPLVGLNIITVDRMYPLTLGSNIGTVITSILSALTADATRVQSSLQVAFSHLFFNIFGILLWYPIPFMRKLPLYLAKGLGKITSQYRWFAVVYLVFMFFLLPLVILGLSIAGVYVLIGVGVPIVLIIIIAAIINCCQRKCHNQLPSFLQTWDFLPKPLHSLQPYDRVITVCCTHSCCQRACRCCSLEQEPEPEAPIVTVMGDDATTPVTSGDNNNNAKTNTSDGHLNEAFVPEYVEESIQSSHL